MAPILALKIGASERFAFPCNQIRRLARRQVQFATQTPALTVDAQIQLV